MQFPRRFRRAQRPERLRLKLKKDASQYSSVDDVFAHMKDFAGVRIATYVESDRDRVTSEVTKRFRGPTGDHVHVDKKDKPESYYRATHCQVALTDDDLAGGHENLRQDSCEIQVCSLLAHVWNEIEHDLQYKPLTGELSEAEHRTLNAQGDLTRAGDTIAVSLLAATDERLANSQGAFRDQWDFVARARRYFPTAADFGAHSGQLFQELLAARPRRSSRILSKTVARSEPKSFSSISNRTPKATMSSASNVRVLISCSCFFSSGTQRRFLRAILPVGAGVDRPGSRVSLGASPRCQRRAKSGYSTSQRRSSPLPRPADRRFLGTRRLTVFGLPAPYRLSPGSFDRQILSFQMLSKLAALRDAFVILVPERRAETYSIPSSRSISATDVGKLPSRSSIGGKVARTHLLVPRSRRAPDASRGPVLSVCFACGRGGHRERDRRKHDIGD